MENVAILVDTPNVSKSVMQKYGLRATPDYLAIRELAASFGKIETALAFVNPGAPRSIKLELERADFGLRCNGAGDCDHSVVASAAELASRCSVIMICSGDKHYRPIVQLMSQVGTRTVICAVAEHCNALLRKIAYRFVGVPVTSRTCRCLGVDLHRYSPAGIYHACRCGRQAIRGFQTESCVVCQTMVLDLGVIGVDVPCVGEVRSSPC